MLINGPVRRRICVAKTLAEKLEHPLGGIARPRVLPLSGTEAGIIIIIVHRCADQLYCHTKC